MEEVEQQLQEISLFVSSELEKLEVNFFFFLSLLEIDSSDSLASIGAGDGDGSVEGS